MGKKEKKSNFSKMLKENAKKIMVQFKGEPKSLSEVMESSLEGLVMSPLDGIIPVSVSEAVENTVAGETGLSVLTSYAQSVFSMYEFALKHEVKQTLLLTFPASEAGSIFEDIWELDNSLDSLAKRSNLQMVLDKIPEKKKNRLMKWAEASDENPSMFIIKIPDLLIFYDNIKKNEVTKAKTFDLVIQFVRTDKSLKKLKKKDGDAFLEVSRFVVEKTARVLKELGISCVHTTLDDRFYNDVHMLASMWMEELSAAQNKILNRCVFCTGDPDTLISFQNQVRTDILNKNLPIKAV